MPRASSTRQTESDPTFIGWVDEVRGPTAWIKLSPSLSSGISIVEGVSYRIGQVGSFVRIPQGYHNLYGVVSSIGAKPTAASDIKEIDRWLTVELVGEAIAHDFQRGVSRHPNVDDFAHLVTQDELAQLYRTDGKQDVAVGSLASAEHIAVRVSADKLLNRHAAILGSTGAGKSTTVASLLRSIVHSSGEQGAAYPASRVMLFDIHGEYSQAFGDIANVFSANPREGERTLVIPFWALDVRDLLKFLLGNLSEEHEAVILDKIQDYKREYLAANQIPGLEPAQVTAETPIPFSLHRLWYDLIDHELMTLTGENRDEPALEEEGDAEALIPPVYTPHALGAAGPFLNPNPRGIKRQLGLLRSRLLDRRFDFLLHPPGYEPNIAGTVENDLDTLLNDWLGLEKSIVILDLSGVPNSVLERLIGSVLRIVYESLYWSREKSEGGVERPMLLVLEEAHRYLSDLDGSASLMVQRIVKEGRKYGVGSVIVSQRPSEVNETVLSQCGTFFAMRLSNPADRAKVKGTLPDNLASLMDMLPVLRTGECVIVGEACKLPVRCRIALPAEEHRPASVDPSVSEGWGVSRTEEGYDRVLLSWRTQNPRALLQEVEIERHVVEDEG